MYFSLVLYFLIVLTFMQDLLPLPGINYLDEILLFVSLFYILLSEINIHRKVSITPFALSIVIIFCVQIVNFLVSPFSNNFFLGLVQTAIHLKVFLLLYLSSRLAKHLSYNVVVITTWFCIFICVVTLLLNLALGELWHVIMQAGIQYRDGLLRPVGMFENTANLGYFFSIVISVVYLCSASYRKNHKNSLFYACLVMFISFMMMKIVTVRKLFLGVIPVIIVLFRRQSAIDKIYLMIIMFSCSMLLIGFIVYTESFLYTETIDNLAKFTSSDHYYIRGLMFYYGMSLFVEYIPFGTGAGTYGTIISTLNTLEVYNHVGLDLGWLVNDSGKYIGIFDNGIGAYLGENGLIGVLSLLFFLYIFAKKIINNKLDVDMYFFIFIIVCAFIGPAWQDGIFSSIVCIMFIYSKLKASQHNTN